MEEDIKILEDFIKYFEAEAISRKYRRNISVTVGEDDIQAIENLIKGYRKLDKENDSKEKAYNDCYCEFKHYKQYESISKSKIKEILERYSFTEHNNCLNIPINVLKELLMEEK